MHLLVGFLWRFLQNKPFHWSPLIEMKKNVLYELQKYELKMDTNNCSCCTTTDIKNYDKQLCPAQCTFTSHINSLLWLLPLPKMAIFAFLFKPSLARPGFENSKLIRFLEPDEEKLWLEMQSQRKELLSTKVQLGSRRRVW